MGGMKVLTTTATVAQQLFVASIEQTVSVLCSVFSSSKLLLLNDVRPPNFLDLNLQLS